jgi:hypothetical protein
MFMSLWLTSHIRVSFLLSLCLVFIVSLSSLPSLLRHCGLNSNRVSFFSFLLFFYLGKCIGDVTNGGYGEASADFEKCFLGCALLWRSAKQKVGNEVAIEMESEVVDLTVH